MADERVNPLICRLGSFEIRNKFSELSESNQIYPSSRVECADSVGQFKKFKWAEWKSPGHWWAVYLTQVRIHERRRWRRLPRLLPGRRQESGGGAMATHRQSPDDGERCNQLLEIDYLSVCFTVLFTFWQRQQCPLRCRYRRIRQQFQLPALQDRLVLAESGRTGRVMAPDGQRDTN